MKIVDYKLLSIKLPFIKVEHLLLCIDDHGTEIFAA